MTSLLPQYRPAHNELLASFPKDAQERVFPYLELVALPRGKTLFEAGDKPRFAYFPINSIIGLLIMVESGASAEISMVGKEGVVDICLFMDGESHLRRAVVQHPGMAWRLSGKRLKDEFHRHGSLMTLMLRHVQLVITETSQTAMCNRYHSIDQQLCRWLLLSIDRLGQDEVTVTQEAISLMLGVRRESITEAAGKLQKKGIIQCSRGRIRVLDRGRLESSSCECYDVIRIESQRLLGTPRHSAIA